MTVDIGKRLLRRRRDGSGNRAMNAPENACRSWQAAKALAVQDNPGNFLAMVQISITLVGTTAAAVGGAEVVRILSPLIADIQGLAPYAEVIALAIVIVVITYFTLVIGELVPKRLVLQNAKNLTLSFTAPVGLLSRLTYIPMRLLLFSADVVLKLLGSAAVKRLSISPEEIEMLVKQGSKGWISRVFLPFSTNKLTGKLKIKLSCLLVLIVAQGSRRRQPRWSVWWCTHVVKPIFQHKRASYPAEYLPFRNTGHTGWRG